MGASLHHEPPTADIAIWPDFASRRAGSIKLWCSAMTILRFSELAASGNAGRMKTEPCTNATVGAQRDVMAKPRPGTDPIEGDPARPDKYEDPSLSDGRTAEKLRIPPDIAS